MSVGVVDHDLLNAVKHEDGGGSNGEEKRDAHAVHHCYECYVQNGRVLVMDEENRAAVEFNILLNGCFAGDVIVASLESPVKHSKGKSVAKPHKSLQSGPVDVKDHSADEGLSNVSEPVRVEVSKLSVEQASKETELLS